MIRFLVLVILLFSSVVKADSFLHVSFDVTRELFKEINEAFVKKTGLEKKIHQSHGGSGKQTVSIIHGLPADIVSLALPHHMDILVKQGIVDKNWRKLFPNNSSPFYTYIAFLVRKGNPKNIKEWADLVRSDVKIIPANPKTSGGALWNYVAAWIYANKVYKNDTILAKEYLKKFYHNAPVLDATARNAGITFVKRKIGDVLITWTNEAEYIASKLDQNYEVIYPSFTVKIEIPVAVITKGRKNFQEMANQYLEFLYSKEAQEIAKKFYYNTEQKGEVVVNVEDYINWEEFKKVHFAENGFFDQIYK